MLIPLVQTGLYRYESLVNLETLKYRADAVARWAKCVVAAHWEQATGKPIEEKDLCSSGSCAFADDENPRSMLFPPKTRPVCLDGTERQRMKAVLALEGVSEIAFNDYHQEGLPDAAQTRPFVWICSYQLYHRQQRQSCLC